MAQTDRQTDKSTAWIATAYNDEIELLEDASRYPAIVKEVHGGREVCPQTGKLHFQGAIILHSQQRLSALKRWLPTAHLEPAKSKEAIKRYCMKQATAAGDKTVRTNAHPYFRMDELLTLLGNVISDLRERAMEEYIDLITDDDDRTKEYWYAVNKVLQTYPRTISSFSQSAIKTAWRYTSAYWISQPTLSITESADKSDSNSPACQEEDDLISPAQV
ncbi:MAG: replication associated protein [Cressdnaviricota sp.]|nr:MAG: replication associated protein [Cressdnaviricota sp.]